MSKAAQPLQLADPSWQMLAGFCLKDLATQDRNKKSSRLLLRSLPILLERWPVTCPIADWPRPRVSVSWDQSSREVASCLLGARLSAGERSTFGGLSMGWPVSVPGLREPSASSTHWASNTLQARDCKLIAACSANEPQLLKRIFLPSHPLSTQSMAGLYLPAWSVCADSHRKRGRRASRESGGSARKWESSPAPGRGCAEVRLW